MDCLTPPLEQIPPEEEKWFCPMCSSPDLQGLPDLSDSEFFATCPPQLAGREASVASSSRHAKNGKSKKKGKGKAVITDESEVEMNPASSPRQSTRRNTRHTAKTPSDDEREVEEMISAEPSRPHKRPRLRLSSPIPPPPPPFAKPPSFRLRLPPRGKGKERDYGDLQRVASPPPLSPLPPPKDILPDPLTPMPILLAGLALAPAAVSQLLARAAAELPLRSVRFPLLGEYNDAFTGEEFVSWLQDNVQGLGGSLDRAEEAAKDLAQREGLLRRLGELGNLFEDSDDAWYQFRPKVCWYIFQRLGSSTNTLFYRHLNWVKLRLMSQRPPLVRLKPITYSRKQEPS